MTGNSLDNIRGAGICFINVYHDLHSPKKRSHDLVNINIAATWSIWDILKPQQLYDLWM